MIWTDGNLWGCGMGKIVSDLKMSSIFLDFVVVLVFWASLVFQAPQYLRALAAPGEDPGLSPTTGIKGVCHHTRLDLFISWCVYFPACQYIHVWKRVSDPLELHTERVANCAKPTWFFSQCSGAVFSPNLFLGLNFKLQLMKELCGPARVGACLSTHFPC